jgi:endonuclease/exonuclease/phosphatase family metal-dependent hydrolase
MSRMTTLRSIGGAIAVVLLGGATALPAGAANAAPADPPVSVVTFNVLAPIWAAPRYYPSDLDAALLDQSTRRARISDFLAGAAPQADVVCLQEVQASEFPAFQAALGRAFDGRMSTNARDYWSSWLTPGLPWQPNGTALFVRRSAIDIGTLEDVPLSADGDHAVLLDGTLRASGRRVRIGSIHLDSDRGNNRVAEARDLLNRVPADPRALDIVCGDFNEDTVTGSLSGALARHGFTDALAAVGNREHTHPWSSTYNRNAMWGIIDHVVVRGGHPVSGDVVDGGVWSIGDETQRIAANFRNVGSDHFPVRATIAP